MGPTMTRDPSTHDEEDDVNGPPALLAPPSITAKYGVNVRGLLLQKKFWKDYVVHSNVVVHFHGSRRQRLLHRHPLNDRDVQTAVDEMCKHILQSGDRICCLLLCTYVSAGSRKHNEQQRKEQTNQYMYKQQAL